MEILESVERILSSGIPVMGHLGLTPQSIHKFGTYAVRAKEEAEAAKLLQDAIALEDAGCFALVLEKIPAALGKKVAETLKIPVIGIGAGKYPPSSLPGFCAAMRTCMTSASRHSGNI